MYKLIDTGSFFSIDDRIQVLDFSDVVSTLEKRAADGRIQEFVSSITPTEGKFYLHINAMGAGEYFGCNRNADYFPEENLKRWFKTFETGPAHLFRHHINKDPAKSCGVVIFSTYNERMHRVELIVEADADLAKDIQDRIARGDYPATSMACKTPYDECSICGNKARTRNEYCDHLRHELGRLYPDGRRVMALNTGPLRFFDISLVVKPADVTSSILQKVASEEDGIVGSAETAEQENLMDKYAEHKKLSELIKELTGEVASVGSNPNSAAVLAAVSDPSEDSLERLSKLPLAQVCRAMADMGISPSIHFLAELAAKKALKDSYFKGAGNVGLQLAMNFADDLPVHLEPTSILEKTAGADFTYERAANAILSREVDRCSLIPEFLIKRASELGYAPVDFKMIHPDGQAMSEVAGRHGANGTTDALIAALVASGVAAISAKSLISHYLMQKSKAPSSQVSNSDAKILIVKSASLMCKLAEESFKHDVAGLIEPKKHLDGPLDPANVAQRLTTGAIKLSGVAGSGKVAAAVGQIFRGVEHNHEQHASNP